MLFSTVLQPPMPRRSKLSSACSSGAKPGSLLGRFRAVLVQEVCRRVHDIEGGTPFFLLSVRGHFSFANITGYASLTSTFIALTMGLMCSIRSGWLHCAISTFPRYGRHSSVSNSHFVSTPACSRSSLLLTSALMWQSVVRFIRMNGKVGADAVRFGFCASPFLSAPKNAGHHVTKPVPPTFSSRPRPAS